LKTPYYTTTISTTTTTTTTTITTTTTTNNNNNNNNGRDIDTTVQTRQEPVKKEVLNISYEPSFPQMFKSRVCLWFG
jgi:hypothetical protein